MDIKTITTTWIKLSLSDLKSANILYKHRQFRTSYFLFQQATEKANKAYALKHGLVKESDLKDIGHDQFKIDRRHLNIKLEEIKKILKEPKENATKLLEKYDTLSKRLKAIESLRNEDLVNISSKDLNWLNKELCALAIPIDKQYPQVKELFKKHNNGSTKGYRFIMHLLLWMQNSYYISVTLKACAILTLQHVTSTRYPQNGQDPNEIYNKKLPVIKKQLLYMNLLEQAIHRLNRHSELKFPEIR